MNTSRLIRLIGTTLALWVGGAGAYAESNTPADAIDWAEARQFWSFQKTAAQSPPRVHKASWVRQTIDAFILAELERHKISPAPEADRRTFIRRVTLDLTGLPPTPVDVEAFVKDRRPDAFERLVDRLLASPAFGERLASLWLNLARYAEDQAHQVGNDTKSFYPNAHLYRAWVIGAFNRDLPYDELVRLQLAADQKGAPASELAALGFLGLGPKYYARNRLDVMADEWEDRVDTVTRTFLGLTVACARCHDHFYDPLTQHDYYALAGVFASTRMVNKTADGLEEKGNPTADKMRADTLHIVEDGDIQNVPVFLRGNVENKGDEVQRGFIRVLSDGAPAKFTTGSGRAELAEAIVDPANPLTARVMVNRLWSVMFGRGLVSTASNFGSLGGRPTHPQLLDDLAARFIGDGWSIKSVLREFALSATYRQSSAATAKSLEADADNQWLGRMNRRRLTIEMWRDSVLSAAGTLDGEGGKSLEIDDPANLHRTVYSRVSRLKLNDVLMQFDYPDANVHAEKRAVSTTAIQKLYLLNSPFMLAQSKAFAERLGASDAATDRERIDLAYGLLFAREATRAERNAGLEFLTGPANDAMPRWEQYAQALLASNEMLYVD